MKARRLSVTVALAALTALASRPAVAQRPERFTDWTRPTFPADEYKARRHIVASRLLRNELMIVPSAEGTSGGETFRQLDDFEYLVGLEVSRSMLAIDGATGRSLLFVPVRDPRFENPGRPNDFPGRPLLGDPEIRALSGVDSVAASSGFDAFVAAAAARGARVVIDVGRAGVARAPVAGAFTIPTPGDLLVAHFARVQSRLVVENGYALMASIRMIKSPREIAVMRAAALATSTAIRLGAARVRPGVDERGLTGAFEADCLALGAQRVAFTPIIKSGENSLWPWRILGAHYDRRNREMRGGELVIYDVGCELDHYVSDVGRTFPVDAAFTPRQRELVEMVRAVSDAVIAAAQPGTTLAALQRVAAASIPAAARPYMQAPLYFGHHLGLDSGDPSLADAALMPGMVFTIEPWYYNHDEGVAVFIEDEIVITPTGSENLTAALPRDADGLERLRRGAQR